MAAILETMLEFTVEKISKLLHIIYKKQTFIAIKTNFTHEKNQIYLCTCMKKPTIKSFFFGSHLGCHIVSRLSYKLFANNKVTFEAFLYLEQFEFDAII